MQGDGRVRSPGKLSEPPRTVITELEHFDSAEPECGDSPESKGWGSTGPEDRDSTYPKSPAATYPKTPPSTYPKSSASTYLKAPAATYRKPRYSTERKFSNSTESKPPASTYPKPPNSTEPNSSYSTAPKPREPTKPMPSESTDLERCLLRLESLAGKRSAQAASPLPSNPYEFYTAKGHTSPVLNDHLYECFIHPHVQQSIPSLLQHAELPTHLLCTYSRAMTVSQHNSALCMDGIPSTGSPIITSYPSEFVSQSLPFDEYWEMVLFRSGNCHTVDLGGGVKGGAHLGTWCLQSKSTNLCNRNSASCDRDTTQFFCVMTHPRLIHNRVSTVSRGGVWDSQAAECKQALEYANLQGLMQHLGSLLSTYLHGRGSGGDADIR